VTSCSLVQRNPTDCGASLCVIKKPREQEGHSPSWVAVPEKIIIIIIIMFISSSNLGITYKYCLATIAQSASSRM
jgi:hypothetical protein